MNEKLPYLRWCDYDWECCMEGGRLIHPDKPWVWYDEFASYILYKSQSPTFILVMGCRRNPNTIQYWDGRTFNPKYGGSLIRSRDTFSYGTFSAEIMLPQGKGLWPSFWLCGEGPWPDSGEIDIMEGYTDNHCFRLTTPYFPWINPSWTTTNNVHYKLLNKHRDIKPRNVSIFRQPYKPYDNWLRYEVRWTPDEIVFSIDGKVVRTETEAGKWFSTPESRMRVIFNCLCADPASHEISCKQAMYIRKFNYTKIEP